MKKKTTNKDKVLKIILKMPIGNKFIYSDIVRKVKDDSINVRQCLRAITDEKHIEVVGKVPGAGKNATHQYMRVKNNGRLPEIVNYPLAHFGHLGF
jgi:predicted transcriptional regulator with HTH domain